MDFGKVNRWCAFLETRSVTHPVITLCPSYTFTQKFNHPGSACPDCARLKTPSMDGNFSDTLVERVRLHTVV